jgi:hypothetical protein
MNTPNPINIYKYLNFLSNKCSVWILRNEFFFLIDTLIRKFWIKDIIWNVFGKIV